jgi:hypothetical protein
LECLKSPRWIRRPLCNGLPKPWGATIDDELVTLSIESGKYFIMDEIGARVWELLEQPVTVSALCSQLTEEYDVEASQCQQDVLAFLTELLAQKIVSRVS